MPRLPRPRLPRRLDHGEEASLVEHLDELRRRLFICIGAIVIGAVIGFVERERLIHYLALLLPRKNRHFIYLGPTEGFTTTIWVAIYFGFVIALPIIIWQAWSFFIPAVEQAHASMMRWFTLLASVLALCGIAFAYFVVLPAAMRFLTNYDSNQFHYLPQAKPFLSFCTTVLLALAVVFELPLFVVGLTRLNILTTRKLRKNRRMGYFIVLLIGLALPGPDIITTALEIIPLVILYESSIWLSVLLDRRSARRLQTPALET